MKYYIYKYENLIDGKTYIGQTNNIKLRQKGHKSVMNNPNDHSYSLPFYQALRKYSLENFSFEVLEEIEDFEEREKVTEREIYYQYLYHSFIEDNGYCLQVGQNNNSFRKPLTFEEKCRLSKILSLEDIKDIQEMLIQGYQFFEVQEKYPNVSDTFLTNINTGINFNNKELSYPLLKLHTRFSLKEQNQIKEKIRNGIPYSAIAKERSISLSFSSQINNGYRWHQEQENYPLCNKNKK